MIDLSCDFVVEMLPVPVPVPLEGEDARQDELSTKRFQLNIWIGMQVRFLLAT